jgi:hypothetical protein
VRDAERRSEGGGARHSEGGGARHSKLLSLSSQIDTDGSWVGCDAVRLAPDGGRPDGAGGVRRVWRIHVLAGRAQPKYAPTIPPPHCPYMCLLVALNAGPTPHALARGVPTNGAVSW